MRLLTIPCRLFVFFVEDPIHDFHDVRKLIEYPKSSAGIELQPKSCSISTALTCQLVYFAFVGMHSSKPMIA